MEDQTFENYLHDLGTLIKEHAREAKEQKASFQGSSAQDYDSGYLMAWYEVVSLMQQQAEAFGIPFEVPRFARHRSRQGSISVQE